jgi:hypothetical protein
MHQRRRELREKEYAKTTVVLTDTSLKYIRKHSVSSLQLRFYLSTDIIIEAL